MARKKKVKPEIQYFPSQMMENLRSIRSYPLTLLEAPSGFGKTTALRHFFDVEVSKTTPVLWHTCFPAAAGISWKAFCEGIGSFDSRSARRLLELGPPDEDNLLDIGRMMQELHCPEEAYLVLDNFAAWNLPSPGNFLMELSGHGGSGLHIVIATQVLPREARREVLLPSRRFSWLRSRFSPFAGKTSIAISVRPGSTWRKGSWRRFQTEPRVGSSPSICSCFPSSKTALLPPEIWKI